MDVLMPQLGETVAEGKITKWFKSAGDAVKPGDNLFEIETDKVSMEVPSITAGTLTEIRVQTGETALVGAVVAVIAGEGGAAASAPAAAPPRKLRRRAVVRKAPTGDLAPRSRTQRRELAAVRPARSVLRGAHAVAQLRPGQDLRRHRRHAAGPPARRRERHRSVAPVGLRPARPHRRSRHRIRHRQGRRPRGAGADRCVGRAGQGALPGRRVRGGAARRHARDHRAPPGRGEADHPALLSRRRRDDGRAPEDPRGGQCRRAEGFATSSRSTTSSSRRWRSRCSACRRRTRSGPATASCASSIPTSASRSRSTAGCSRR